MCSHDHTQVSKRIIPSLILYFLALKTIQYIQKSGIESRAKKKLTFSIQPHPPRPQTIKRFIVTHRLSFQRSDWIK